METAVDDDQTLESATANTALVLCLVSGHMINISAVVVLMLF